MGHSSSMLYIWLCTSSYTLGLPVLQIANKIVNYVDVIIFTGSYVACLCYVTYTVGKALLNQEKLDDLMYQ